VSQHGALSVLVRMSQLSNCQALNLSIQQRTKQIEEFVIVHQSYRRVIITRIAHYC
jgi:hypothetical protein